MRERTMDEMIKYFNDTVSAMDISRKDKMTILGMIVAIGYKHQDECKTYQEIIETDRAEIDWLKKCVNDLPKPARSKWVNVEVSYVGDMKHNGVENVASMQCQNCKRYHNEVYFFGQAIEHVNYCPNCGARMEVDTNDSETIS